MKPPTEAPAGEAMNALTASRSSNGRTVNQSGSGSNPARILSWSVALIAAIVRPWNACLKVTMRNFSGWPSTNWQRRAVLTAHSNASAPELVKNIVSAKVSATSRSATATWPGTWYRFDTCISVAAWSWIVLVRCGWPWPRQLTAIPAAKSSQRLPSASNRYAPSPRTGATSQRP